MTSLSYVLLLAFPDWSGFTQNQQSADLNGIGVYLARGSSLLLLAGKVVSGGEVYLSSIQSKTQQCS